MRTSRDIIVKVLILTFPLFFLFFFFILPLIKIFTLAFGIPLSITHIFSVIRFLDVKILALVFGIQIDNTTAFLFKVLNHPLNKYFLYWDIQQALVTTILCLIIGMPGSYALAHYQFPGRSLLRNLLTIPFILPPIVVLIGFITVFGHGSWINEIWKNLTGVLLIDIYNTYEGIILAHVFYNIPVIVRLTEIGWKNIDPELIAVGRSLKASRWQIFWKIQFPQLFPILAVASLLVFIYAFNSFAIVLVLGGVQYQTLEVRIYSLAKGTFDFNSAAALTLVQIFINIVIIIFYLYYSNKYEIPIRKQLWNFEKKLVSKPLRISTILKVLSIFMYFIFVGVICVLPILGVFFASCTSSDGTFTLEYYTKLFNLNLRNFIGLAPQTMIFNSIFFGIGVIFLALTLALLLNYGVNYETTFKGTPKLTLRQSISGIIVILPLAVSSITLAFALFSLYRFTPIYENVSAAIIIAQTLIAFPFANRIIAGTRANIDPTIINVARSLGASRLRTFIKVELPLLLPGVIVAGLFSFAISIGEFGATSFLARANFATIPVGIYRLIDTRNIGPAASFSTILVIITVISFTIIEKFGSLEFRF
ncbi:MAG: ABC transporter permease [Candidatus Thorarchaeota archaeon]